MCPLEPEPTELLQAMEALRALLDRHGVTRWADWVRRDLEALRRGDRHGATHFLSAFGGMGSLNDLLICPQNNHRIEEREVEGVNRELARLRSRAHGLAESLARR